MNHDDMWRMTPKRKLDGDAVNDADLDNTHDVDPGQGAGFDMGAQEEETPRPARRQRTNGTSGTSGGATQLIMSSAQDALNSGLDRLHPEVVQWGQTLLGSMVMSATPVRRTLKLQPVLTGVGLGAIAVGGILVALALTRDNQGAAKPAARRQPARAN